MTILLILAANYVLVRLLFPSLGEPPKIPYTAFKEQVVSRNVAEVFVKGVTVKGKFVKPVATMASRSRGFRRRFPRLLIPDSRSSSSRRFILRGIVSVEPWQCSSRSDSEVMKNIGFCATSSCRVYVRPAARRRRSASRNRGHRRTQVVPPRPRARHHPVTPAERVGIAPTLRFSLGAAGGDRRRRRCLAELSSNGTNRQPREFGRGRAPNTRRQSSERATSKTSSSRSSIARWSRRVLERMPLDCSIGKPHAKPGLAIMKPRQLRIASRVVGEAAVRDDRRHVRPLRASSRPPHGLPPPERARW